MACVYYDGTTAGTYYQKRTRRRLSHTFPYMVYLAVRAKQLPLSVPLFHRPGWLGEDGAGWPEWLAPLSNDHDFLFFTYGRPPTSPARLHGHRLLATTRMGLLIYCISPHNHYCRQLSDCWLTGWWWRQDILDTDLGSFISCIELQGENTLKSPIAMKSIVKLKDPFLYYNIIWANWGSLALTVAISRCINTYNVVQWMGKYCKYATFSIHNGIINAVAAGPGCCDFPPDGGGGNLGAVNPL